VERQVVHINIARFMCSVEELDDRGLRGWPFVVAPPGAERAIALDVSEAAYREGVRRGMPLAAVRARIRSVRVVVPRHGLYASAERELYAEAARYSPLVEMLPGAHLYIDITGTGRLFGRPVDLAARLRRGIQARTGLNPIAGLATNKLVSKVATRVVKPSGFVAVPPGDERRFLSCQEVGILPGVGVRISARLLLLGIREIGELADLSDGESSGALGPRGVRLRNCARGIDAAPVMSEGGRAVVQAEWVFDTDTADIAEIRPRLYALAEEAGTRLRAESLESSRFRIELAYTDGKRARFSAALGQGEACDRDLFDAAEPLLSRGLARRVRIRRMRLVLADLAPACGQMDLFPPPGRVKAEALQAAIDSVRRRYGRAALVSGAALPAAEGPR
jgi:DNA polymerase IV